MTPEQIQKIVDGEYSHRERATLLSQIGNDSESWRTLTLALLEDKEWSAQIRSIDGIATGQRFTATPHLVRASVESVQPLVQTRDGMSKKIYRPLLSALAASILVLMGFYGGMQLRDDTPAPFVAPLSHDANLGVNNMIAANGADGDEGMRILWPNAEGGSIPLFDGKEFDPTVVWAKDEGEFNRMNEQLRQRGFELERSPQLLTGTLNDGRRLIIPVNNVDLKPYGY